MPSSSEDDDDDSVFQSQYNGSASSSSPSPPPLQHNFFAPPFYNRPPTPLPPSPSLTSLLRPSRPTTPDSSDNEAISPVPRASPKVPTYEYYGFVLYLFSTLAFLIYLLWSYLPSPFLHALGIHYYPNRWWSLAIPSFLVMLLVYIYVALAAYNTGHLTLKMSDIETIVDDAANVVKADGKGSMESSWDKKKGVKGAARTQRGRAREGEKERDWRSVSFEGTDAVMDVPLGGVCEVLYGEAGEEDDEALDFR